MGRLTRGKPLAVLLVATGLLGLWALAAVKNRLDRVDVDVPPGTDPTFVWGDPAGDYEGQEPKAVVMVIHGGGWEGVNRTQLQHAAQLAVNMQKLGYATMAVDYRAGAKGLADIERFYAEARRRAGPDTPVCAFGESAGGNLALVLAEREPDLACVIANIAPTDLPALGRSGASDAAAAVELAETAFGSRDELERFSPALHPNSTSAAIFALYADNDPLIAPSQGDALKRALPQTQLFVLGSGDEPFGHIFAPQAEEGLGVDGDQLDEATQAEIDFLEGVTERASG